MVDKNYYVSIRQEFDSVEKSLTGFSRFEEEFSTSQLFGSLERYLRHPVNLKNTKANGSYLVSMT